MRSNFRSSIFALTGASMPAAVMLTDHEAAYRGRQEWPEPGLHCQRRQLPLRTCEPNPSERFLVLAAGCTGLCCWCTRRQGQQSHRVQLLTLEA